MLLEKTQINNVKRVINLKLTRLNTDFWLPVYMTDFAKYRFFEPIQRIQTFHNKFICKTTIVRINAVLGVSGMTLLKSFALYCFHKRTNISIINVCPFQNVSNERLFAYKLKKFTMY